MICLQVRDSPEILITPMKLLVKTPPEAKDEEDGEGKCPNLPPSTTGHRLTALRYSQVYRSKDSGQLLTQSDLEHHSSSK